MQRELALCQGARVGVGFITWALHEKPGVLSQALAHEPAAVQFSFGDCGEYIRQVHAANTPAIAQVQTVAGAREAAAAGADVIVAQGTEGGGHGGWRSTMALVPAVVDAVAPVPVVAAGGIADGRGLAAALMLGACGALMGTRFYATPEALGLDNAKRMIAESGGDGTRRTQVFDIVRGYHWPDGYTGRAVINRFVRDWHGNEDALEADLPAQQAAYIQAVSDGDANQAVVFAGEALDLVPEIEPAGTIVSRVTAEAEALLGRRWV
jgi:nitronate monooxygenase